MTISQAIHIHVENLLFYTTAGTDTAVVCHFETTCFIVLSTLIRRGAGENIYVST